jgi:hypothetical protein
MPTTALAHFSEDVARARAIVTHANPLPAMTPGPQLLRGDLLRSAWMFAVGALDAYFCDAYTDLVAATIISKSRHPAMVLPEFFYNIKFPVRAILEPYAINLNWRWRMAARKMMEGENVLSLDEVKKLFNKFFRKGQRLFGDLLDAWIRHPQSRKGLFGITPRVYASLDAAAQHAARQVAKVQMDDRFAKIIQRRHDCIHNCDRPRMAPQPLVKGGTVIKVIEDVEFLVNRCDEHINGEFRQFLLLCGCPRAIVAQAGY